MLFYNTAFITENSEIIYLVVLSIQGAYKENKNYRVIMLSPDSYREHLSIGPKRGRQSMKYGHQIASAGMLLLFNSTIFYGLAMDEVPGSGKIPQSIGHQNFNPVAPLPSHKVFVIAKTASINFVT